MKVGFLLLHGFTGAPYEVMPLAEYLQDNGYEVEVPTLTGHGGDLRLLRGVSSEVWKKDAERALSKLRQRCDRVFIVGFSMGGLLAVNLAVRYKITGLIMLSAPIFVWDFPQMFRNLFTDLRLKQYPMVKELFQRAWNTPLTAVLNFQRLLRNTKSLIPQVNSPVIIVQGKKDATVKVKSANYFYQNIGAESKRLYFLPQSRHLVCCGPEKARVHQLVQEFAMQLLCQGEHGN